MDWLRAGPSRAKMIDYGHTNEIAVVGACMHGEQDYE